MYIKTGIERDSNNIIIIIIIISIISIYKINTNTTTTTYKHPKQSFQSLLPQQLNFTISHTQTNKQNNNPLQKPHKMLVGDLIHFRAALSNGVSHDLILCPSTANTTPAASRRNSTAANTPDNRSIASNEDKKHSKASKKRHWWSRSSTPAVKAANCGAGMKLPMNVV